MAWRLKNFCACDLIWTTDRVLMCWLMSFQRLPNCDERSEERRAKRDEGRSDELV